ncbi:MAG: hypothetical protein IJM33_08465 [Bacteroidales bacterium]|nr:hypothetical protein [Bacteroidales bacterium]MBR3412370.1 hypothetical protein [Bacteroidales bacterium]
MIRENKTLYVVPTVLAFDVRVEKGFAGSNTPTPEPEGNTTETTERGETSGFYFS